MVDSRFRRAVVLLVGALVVAGSTAAGQSLINREYDLKAAYIYNFGRYIQWPSLGDEFVIGVLGKDPFAAQLHEIESTRTMAGHKVVVRRFNSADEYAPCNILFISRLAVETRPAETPEDRLKAALEKTKGLPVLIVTETQGHASKGASIDLFVDPDTFDLRMEINPDSIKRAGLKVSAPLLGLRVATVVRDSE